MILKSDSSAKTVRTGSSFAAKLKSGDIVALIGDLGAGKTQFVKGMAEYFGISQLKVTSPTFTFLNVYEGKDINFYHFDWYRIKNKKEIFDTGAEEFLFGDGISVVEWYDSDLYDIPDRIEVRFTIVEENRRDIILPDLR